ncbi:MAG TPA: PepSY-like domain-containing protein [Chitinophagaceae bacterium]|jgi:hypothetical protein
MKKHLLLLAFAGGLALTAVAQKGITPPAAANTAFQKAYPGISNVKWEKEGPGYEANFKQNGTEMSAVYDAKGVLQETETSIKIAELPPAVADYVKTHYKGAVLKEAAKVTKANGTVNYEAEVNKKDVIFDAKGVFIKEEKD